MFVFLTSFQRNSLKRCLKSAHFLHQTAMFVNVLIVKCCKSSFPWRPVSNLHFALCTLHYNTIKVCCICGKFYSQMMTRDHTLRSCPAYCDKGSHCVNLGFCHKTTVIRRVTAFYAPIVNRILFSYFPLVNTLYLDL